MTAKTFEVSETIISSEVIRLEKIILDLQGTVDALKGQQAPTSKKNYIKNRKSKLIGVRLDQDVYDVLEKLGPVSTQVNAICRQFCNLSEYVAE